MTLDEACRAAVAKLDGAIACGVVDLRSGAMLGLHQVAHHPAVLDAAGAAAFARLFRGPELAAVLGSLRPQAGDPRAGDGHEIHILADETARFAKSLKTGTAAIVLVAARTTNLGLGWAVLKSLVPIVENQVA